MVAPGISAPSPRPNALRLPPFLSFAFTWKEPYALAVCDAPFDAPLEDVLEDLFEEPLEGSFADVLALDVSGVSPVPALGCLVTRVLDCFWRVFWPPVFRPFVAGFGVAGRSLSGFVLRFLTLTSTSEVMPCRLNNSRAASR